MTERINERRNVRMNKKLMEDNKEWTKKQIIVEEQQKKNGRRMNEE